MYISTEGMGLAGLVLLLIIQEQGKEYRLIRPVQGRPGFLPIRIMFIPIEAEMYIAEAVTAIGNKETTDNGMPKAEMYRIPAGKVPGIPVPGTPELLPVHKHNHKQEPALNPRDETKRNRRQDRTLKTEVRFKLKHNNKTALIPKRRAGARIRLSSRPVRVHKRSNNVKLKHHLDPDSKIINKT